MKHRRRPEKAQVELNLTPMIDVVFQLLIYFLLGTSFAVGEQTFRLDVPDRGESVEIDPFELDVTPVVVQVAGAGRISVDGPWDGPVHVDALLVPTQKPAHGERVPQVVDAWAPGASTRSPAQTITQPGEGFLDRGVLEHRRPVGSKETL